MDIGHADQRYYAVGMGRFGTVDPMGLNAAKLQNPGTWNRYAYALADPVNLADPTGQITCDRLLFLGLDGGCENDPCDPSTYENGFMPSPDPSCYADPGPAPPPDPAAKKCPQYISNFFSVVVPIANQLSAKMNTDSNFILALSAYESGWLGQHAQDLHNLFGLTNAGGNDLTFSSYQASADYFASIDAVYVTDDWSIQQFAKDIQPHYNTVNPNWASTLISVYNSVLAWRSICNQ